MALNNGLIISNGKDVNPAWTDCLAIGVSPLLSVPAGLTASAYSGGSLTSGTTYYYAVSSIGNDGESALSTEATDTASTPNLSMTLAWTAVGYVKKYKVYRGTTTGVYDVVFYAYTNSFIDDGTQTVSEYIINTTTATLTAGGTLPNNTYYYKVSPIGLNGEYLPGAQVNATTSGAKNTVYLTWAPVPFTAQYVVYRSITSGVYSQACVTYLPQFTDNGTKTFIDRTIKTSTPVTVQRWDTIKYKSMKQVKAIFIQGGFSNGDYIKTQSYIVIDLDDSNSFQIDLMQVYNQSTWSTGTQAGTQQALADIEAWKSV